MVGAGKPQGPGWWQASDGAWYPPELHPDAPAATQQTVPSAYEPPPSAYEPAPGYAQPPHQNLGAPPALQFATQSAPGYPPASPGALVLPHGVVVASPWARLGSYLLEALLFVITLGIGWIIWALTIGGIGQTPAKNVLGLRVIRADSLQPVGLGRMFWMRGLLASFVVQFVAIFTLGIILFMPFWDKRNQNLWDKISTTYVVSDTYDAWNTRPHA